MGHLVGKDMLRQLGRKIDGMEMRAPWNDKLHEILRELYSVEEADVVIRMPYGLSTIEQLERATRMERPKLQRVLAGLAAKGLVMDLWLNEAFHYLPSPFVIGIFEFTMMRMGPYTNSREWAKLFHDYMEGDGSFLAANFGHGNRISIMRTLPHEDALDRSDHVEVLDYERASHVIGENSKFAIGICSCRHEMLHLDEKRCDAPLESCTQFGFAAEFMIRNGIAREIGRSEMEEHFARSKELGLLLAVDNVRRNMKFVCHCCKCCCNVLRAVNQRGYPNFLVTSTYLATISPDTCTGCGKCATACPVEAISMDRSHAPARALLDGERCVGCGICAVKCPVAAVTLEKRGQRVIHPETTFERIMLQSLERGTMENQIFTDPASFTEKAARAFVGAFLRLPPVKKVLLGNRLRSTFLALLKEGATRQGKGWMTEL